MLGCGNLFFARANVIKLCTVVIYWHVTVIPPFCVLKQYCSGDYHGMALNYHTTVFTAKNDSITNTTVSNTMIIYDGILTLEKVIQGIPKGEVSLYSWLPVWLVWNQLYDNWQLLFLFPKQTNPNQSNRRSMVQILPPLVFPGRCHGKLPLLFIPLAPGKTKSCI